MRKRRRLADKLTIMVCAVLVAVSAFFYAPMDVSASESFTHVFPETTMNYTGYNFFHIYGQSFGGVNLKNYYDLKPDTYYSIDLSFNYNGYTSSSCSVGNFYLFCSSNSYSFKNEWLLERTFFNNSSNFISSRTIIFNSSRLSDYTLSFGYNASFYSYGSAPFDLIMNCSVSLSNLQILTGEQSSSYENGYNAGFSVGEQVGESNGYSNGYSDGFDAGEQSGYDSGFQAGQDSVDTQSYYDMGYSAGYDAGYLSGYDVGYDAGYDDGWSAYEAQMDKWGADTNDYPSLVFHYLDSDSGSFDGGSFGGSTAGMESAVDLLVSESFETDFVINPNHTYRISVLIDNLQFAYTQNRIVCSSNTSFITVGGISYLIHSSYPYVADDITSTFYMSGNSMASVLSFDFIYNSAVTYGLTMPQIFYDQFGFYIYDMGPSGDTQNHIANQTDQLTGGFNDSQGNSVNNDFSSGLNEFETAEDSLFATATTGMKDFTFFDISSVPAMVTGMSFVGSIMSGWFAQAGGASGVGIVLSILFSIMLVAMVLGLYRWYQSKGGKD